MSDLAPGAVLSLVWRAIRFELRLYVSLLRWIARRPDVEGAGAEVFGYAQAVTPVMWLWIFASAVEVPLFHLLIPWDGVRIAGLVLGVWGLLWMVGFLASLNVYPHLLDGVVLRVRNGASIDITIPWDAVATIAVQRRDLASSVWTLQPRETANGTDLQVGVSGQVNVHVVLREPLSVPVPKGARHVTELSFWADDPRALVRRAHQAMKLEGRAGHGI